MVNLFGYELIVRKAPKDQGYDLNKLINQIFGDRESFELSLKDAQNRTESIKNLGLGEGLEQILLTHTFLATPDLIPVLSLMEAKAFNPPGKSTFDTFDALEYGEFLKEFMDKGGHVFMNTVLTSYIEVIKWENFLKLDLDGVEDDSPAKYILNQQGLVDAVNQDYIRNGVDVFYLHGLGVWIEGIGAGTRIVQDSFDRTGYVKGGKVMLSGAQEVTRDRKSNKIFFAYIDVGPETENVNRPSFRLFMRKEGSEKDPMFVADRFEEQVYLDGVSYLRCVTPNQYDVDSSAQPVRVSLSDGNYLNKIREVLVDGYVGVFFNPNKEKSKQIGGEFVFLPAKRRV